MTAGGDDLRHKKLGGLSWHPDKAAESLDSVCAQAIAEAEDAIEWYLRKKRPKQRGARWLRIAAILMTALAGLIPIWIQMYPGPGGVAPFPPAWASVAAALAALLIAFDQFLGHSAGWMRFLLTEMRIRRALQIFQYDVEAEKATWRAEPPKDEQIQRMLARTKAFAVEVNGIVESETSAWTEEFKSTLKQLDEAAKVKAEVGALGGVNIVVVNGAECRQGWDASIDGAASVKHTGTSAAVAGLTTGMHTVTVVGTISDASRRAEKLVLVTGGAIATVELTLA